MKAKKLLLIVLFSALVLGSWNPALAAPSPATGGPRKDRFYIINKTDKPFWVTLIGPKSLTIYAEPGLMILYLPKGLYIYRYSACGYQVSGTFLMGPSWNGIGMTKCKYVNQLVKNNTGGTLQIKLDGSLLDRRGTNEKREAHLNFKLAPGNSRIKVPQGFYSFTVTGCGKTRTGKINLRGNIPNWTWECKGGKLTTSTHSR